MPRQKYVIDTNLYIAAIRDETKAEELAEFSSAFSPYLYMSSVVAKELLVGADPTKKARRRIENALIDPFERMGRLVTPSHDCWKRAGGIVARLRRQVNLATGEPLRTSFWNDALIAVSCARVGLAVISNNKEDFELIRSLMPFSFREPWPS